MKFLERWRRALKHAPRSVIAVGPSHTFSYMKPEAAWGPDMLSFDVQIITAQEYAASGYIRRMFGADEKTAPDVRDFVVQELDAQLVGCLLEASQGLEREGYVLDAAGWRVDVEVDIRVRVIGKCWPAVPGVTAPENRKDDTR